MTLNRCKRNTVKGHITFMGTFVPLFVRFLVQLLKTIIYKNSGAAENAAPFLIIKF